MTALSKWKSQAFQLWFMWLVCSILVIGIASCSQKESKGLNASQILGNHEYPAVCYGGYRENTRNVEPSNEQLKEDLRILSALGIKILRTYQAAEFPQAENLLKAISELKKENSEFEMYVMLGAWIECEKAWTENPDHSQENFNKNRNEVRTAIRLANYYPDIVKVIAVGNESMVHWAESYYVYPDVVLRWVNLVQSFKEKGKLSQNIWVTSSDNFASWGGGDSSYYNSDLLKLIEAVDYVSIHTYPFHDTHYNSEFWIQPSSNDSLDKLAQIDFGVIKAIEYARNQFVSVQSFLQENDLKKPIHIGETGWASVSTDNYGYRGSNAADEYKQREYYRGMKEWTDSLGVSCFFFEAFDEPWKDAKNTSGSENHFGWIDIESKAKYILWDQIEEGKLNGLKRNGKKILKSYNGNLDSMMRYCLSPPIEVIENEIL